MNQNDAPVGTLAYLGHPENHRLVQKQDDGTWFLVRPMPVYQIDDEDFRAGWHPLAVEAQREPEVGDPPHPAPDHRCNAHDRGYVCTLETGHTGRHAASGTERVIHVWEQAPDPNVEPDVEYAVNDADPTAERYGDVTICNQTGPGGEWVCTWERGHAGQHVAGDGDYVLEVWGQ